MKKFLLPIDFSFVANNATEYAAVMAKKYNATLTLLNVQTTPAVSADFIEDDFYMPYGEERKTLESQLEGYCEEIRKEFNVRCDFEIAADFLTDAIIKKAEKDKYDLIIMGTGGADTITQMLTGSNTYKVFKDTEVPVLMLPVNTFFKDLDEIVFATEFHNKDGIVLKQLYNLFDKREITVLHVDEIKTPAAETAFDLKKALLDINSDKFLKLDYKLINSDDTANAIDDYMIDNKANLLVLALPKYTFMQKLMRKSISKHLSNIATYPILVMHY